MTGRTFAKTLNPGRQVDAQAHAHVWIYIPSNGASINASYGVASLDDTGTGDRQVNFLNDFTSTNYVCVDSYSIPDAGNAGKTVGVTNLAAGAVDVNTRTLDTSATMSAQDVASFLAIFGDLA